MYFLIAVLANDAFERFCVLNAALKIFKQTEETVLKYLNKFLLFRSLQSFLNEKLVVSLSKTDVNISPNFSLYCYWAGFIEI